MRLWEINTDVCGVYSPERRVEVFCFWLNYKVARNSSSTYILMGLFNH